MQHVVMPRNCPHGRDRSECKECMAHSATRHSQVQQVPSAGPIQRGPTISHEVCGYVRCIVRELIKRNALRDIVKLKDIPDKYWKQVPRARACNQREFLASKQAGLDFAREYFTPEHIDVGKVGDNIDEAEFLACLRGPVLYYADDPNCFQAFQSGAWHPPGLNIPTLAGVRCLPGVGKRTAEAILNHYSAGNQHPGMHQHTLQHIPSSGGSEADHLVTESASVSFVSSGSLPPFYSRTTAAQQQHQIKQFQQYKSDSTTPPPSTSSDSPYDHWHCPSTTLEISLSPYNSEGPTPSNRVQVSWRGLVPVKKEPELNEHLVSITEHIPVEDCVAVGQNHRKVQ